LTKLEIKNGLPGINIRKITKDKFGFMWFATQDGISRFDGKSFINLNSYAVDVKRRIVGTDVYDVKPDKSGDFLWVLTAYGGLNKIDLRTCNVIATYEVAHSIKPDETLWYKCFFESGNYLVIGTFSGIISVFDKKLGKTISSFSLGDRFQCNGQLEDLFIDKHNRVWFLISGTGVLITDESCKTKKHFIPSEQLHSTPFDYTDYAVYDNTVLLTTSVGLKQIDETSMNPVKADNRRYFRRPHFDGKELHAISVADSLAIICGKDLLLKTNLQSGVTERIQFAGNFEDHSWITLTSAVFINGKTIWIGSQSGVGWVRDISSPFASFYSSFDGENVKINHAITIAASTDSTVLVCALDGLYKVGHNNAAIKKFPVEDLYYSVFPVTRNYFIASGVSKGLQLLNDHFQPVNLLDIFPELHPIKNDLLMCAARSGDSLIFMASQNKNGLYIWNTRAKSIESFNTRTKGIFLQNDNINRLFIDSKERLWIVCENAVSIYDYRHREMRHLSLLDPGTKAPLNINMDICENNKGFWLASYGAGIIKLNDKLEIERIYAAKEGINNLGLYKIFSLNDSALIASSNNGMTLLNTNTGIAKNYFTEDGLQSNSFEEASGDQYGNFIFLGGINGITRIDIRKIVNIKPPPALSFSTISLTSQQKVTDTLHIQIDKLRIPHFVSQITINFSAINYTDPEKTRFAYRILEKENDWNFTLKNSIQSFRLSPGSYTLQVKAINEDGVESEIKELTLIFLPKWYQTGVFKTLLALVAIAIGYGLYRIRISQLKKEEKIRNQLASDLHDDLGSTLNSVKVYSNLALMEKGNPQHLEKIKEGTQDAIAGVRDLIWVLDDKKDVVQDLLARIKQFAQPLCEANHIAYVEDVAATVSYFKLEKEEKRNLYMILKESINNSIKYSGCSAITLHVTGGGKKISFTISDNGKGFDATTIKPGNGLKNIRNRAKDIHYTVTIASSPGNGTTITLEKA
jgi:signal transduction histidine kinase